MSFFKENVKGSNVKPEILHEDKMDESEKNVSKWFFWYSTPSWWKCNLKNICLFFPIFTKEIQAKINELESESNIFA